MNPLLLKDGYKASHRQQYPKGTEFIYSNFTPRSNKHGSASHVVVFGIQAFIKKYLIDSFNNDFFNQPKAQVVEEYKAIMDAYLGVDYDVSHIEALWENRVLPLRIKALPEGTRVPMGVPVLTVINTKAEFFWLTNLIESLLSTELWLPMTSATTAYTYRELFTKYAKETGSTLGFIPFQGHDFSMRGMECVEAGQASGAGHLTSFYGSDSIPAIPWLMENYNAKGLIACTVPATEHSVMCAGGKDDEQETFRRLIEDVYPSGIVSIVSDTWDLWRVVTEFLPALKSKIMARDGKVVIRPDTGNPADILCGLPDASSTVAQKGLIEALWDTFGGTVNAKGFKELDVHIGAIYGDSITLKIADEILSRLAAKGFSASNVVMGIGSYTYTYVTRDTYGFAMKATWSSVNNEAHELFKEPATDIDKLKKSAKGLLRVDFDGKECKLTDQVSPISENLGMLKTVFEDSKLLIETDLDTIRNRLWPVTK